MIQLIMDGLEGGAQVGEVHHPPRVTVDLAANLNLDAKRMPMQTRALVAHGNEGQAVRRFDGEFAVEIQADDRWSYRCKLVN